MSSRPPRRGRRILAVLGGIVLAVLAAEIGLRIVARSNGRPHDSEAERLALEMLAAGEQAYSPTFRGALPSLGEVREGPKGPEAQALRMLHPFTGWETAPGMELTAELVGPDGSAPRDPRAYRIVLTGGSVAAMFARLGTERLVQRLSADPRLAGRTPQVLAYGRTGGKQPQQLMTVAWLLTLGVVPDAVLNLDGYNEVAVGSENAARGTNPLYPSIPHWAALALVGGLDRDVIKTAGRALDVRDAIKDRAEFSLRWGLYKSEIGLLLSRSRLGPLQAEQSRLHDEFFQALKRSETSGVLRGPPFDVDPVHAITQAAGGWERDSRMMHDLCKARGILYVHALQPALYDPAGKKPTERELAISRVADSWKQGVQVGYPLLREAGKRLASEGIGFVDTSNAFVSVEGDVFVDSCHFEERGNEILADRLAQEILARLP